MRHPGQPRAAASPPRRKRPGNRQQAERALAWVLISLSGATLMACQQAPREIPQSKAKPGDRLVRFDNGEVTLVKPFRQGEPNGLFDGVVRLTDASHRAPVLMEINAVCSLPGEPNWPSYDNLYGRVLQRAEEAAGRSGDTQWQILYHFSGSQEVKMGIKPGPWVDRLRDNLCRRSDFDDRPKK